MDGSRVRSAFQLGHRLFEGLDRLGFAFLGQLVPVDFQHQAILCLADNSSRLRQGRASTYQSGLLRSSEYEESMILKLMLIRAFLLVLASTECGNQAGNKRRLPFLTFTTT